MEPEYGHGGTLLCFLFLVAETKYLYLLKVPVVSTSVGSGRAINKLQWNKDGRHAALGGSDGRLYVYDIGDMGTGRGGEVEWTEMGKVVAGIQPNGVEAGR